LRTLASALKGGGIKQKPWLDIQTNVKTVTASDARAFPYQLDGDYLGEVREVTFEYVPDAVRLVRSHPPL
jgi:diacylglycerol kinase family enzyme